MDMVTGCEHACGGAETSAPLEKDVVKVDPKMSSILQVALFAVACGCLVLLVTRPVGAHQKKSPLLLSAKQGTTGNHHAGKMEDARTIPTGKAAGAFGNNGAASLLVSTGSVHGGTWLVKSSPSSGNVQGLPSDGTLLNPAPRSSAVASLSSPSNDTDRRRRRIMESWQWLEEIFSREAETETSRRNRLYDCTTWTPNCMGTGAHPRCRPLSVHQAPTKAELKLPRGSKVLAFGHSFLANAFTSVVSVVNRAPLVTPLTQQALTQRRLHFGEVEFVSINGMRTTPPPPPPSRPACPEIDDYSHYRCTRNDSTPGVATLRYVPYSDGFGVRMKNAGAPDPDACGKRLASLGLNEPRPAWEHFDEQNATLISLINIPQLQSGANGCLENLRQFLKAEEGGFDAVVFMRPHKTGWFDHHAHALTHPGAPKLRPGMPGWVDLGSRHDEGGSMSSKTLAALFATAAPTVIEMLQWTTPLDTPKKSKCTLREHFRAHGRNAYTTSRLLQDSMRQNQSFVIDLNSCLGGDAFCGRGVGNQSVCISGNRQGDFSHGTIGHQCNPGPMNIAAATALKIIQKRMAAGHRRAGYGVHWAPRQ